jgi:formate-dependent nitrite reductase cytochrome c552 subunit
LICLGVLLLLSSGALGEDAKDTCVDCHSRLRYLVTNKKLYDYYQNWKLSIHREEDVSCADCHGGNPQESDKDTSHGVKLTGSEDESAVNFRNIPDTCGRCHKDFLEGYRESSHFEHLVAEQQEEQGPNCVTCHGSINEETLNVNTVQEACARCHNEETDNHPEIPGDARLILNKFLSIDRFYRYVTVRADPEKTQEFFKDADARIYDLSVAWHTFELEEIREHTDSVLRFLREKRRELRKQRETSRR